MITKLSIGHFKAIASATIPLGPITVLVGPNDSGKSTILQALMALARAGNPKHFPVEELLGCQPSVAVTYRDASANGAAPEDIKLIVEGHAGLVSKTEEEHQYLYMTSLSAQRNVFAGERAEWDGQPKLSAVLGGAKIVHPNERSEGWTGRSTELSVLANEQPSSRGAQIKSVFEAIASDLRSTLLRLDARAIAKPTALGAPLLSDGSGLVGIVDELLTSGVGDEQIARVNEAIRRLSPHVKGVAARRHAASGGKELHFVLRNGAVIPASQMSDGIVLAAAIAVVALGSGNQRLLIEEPENGLHPRQLKVVADAIRSISEEQGAQVVLTTHSPLLLNHFAAEEVVLVTRDQAGVHVRRMSEAQGLDDLASEMALGELWYNVGDSNLARPA